MGSKEGARKAAATMRARDPNYFKKLSSLGGRSVKDENRTFFKNRTLARQAGSKGGRANRN